MEIFREEINSWSVASLQGPFTIKTLRDVQEIIDEVLQHSHPLLALDISNVSYMDSSAIGIILAANRNYTQKNGYIATFGANETISEIFETIKLGNHIPVYANRDEFIAAT